MPLLTDDQRQGLAELYESNRVDVSRLCRRILNDPEEAADACHEVFIRAANEFAAGTLPTSPRMWLLTVARNHCLDLLRRRKRLGKALNAIRDMPDVPANPEVAVIGRQNVDSLLRKLSPRERKALWQSAIENKPIAEIATGLRVTYLAAAQVLSRARRHAALAAANVASILGLLRLHRMLRGGPSCPDGSVGQCRSARCAGRPTAGSCLNPIVNHASQAIPFETTNGTARVPINGGPRSPRRNQHGN